MAYPDPSTFRSPERGSAWLRVGAMVAATQGYTFVVQLQSNLRAALAAGLSGSNYANGVRASDLALDGDWGPLTNRALYAWAQARGAGPPDLATIRNVEAGAQVDPRSLQWAAAVVLGETVDAIEIPPGTAAPGYRVPAPPDNPADRVVITFSPAGHEPAPDPITAPGQPLDAPDAGPEGWAPAASGGGISGGAIAAGVGVLVAGAAAAYAASPSANPSRRKGRR